MTKTLNSELTFETKSLLAYLLIPLLMVVPASVYLSFTGVKNTLQSTGAYYVDRIEDVISEVKTDTSLAMNHLSSCKAIGDKLLFASHLRELIIVRNNTAICSSKRGSLNEDVTNELNGHPITSGVFLYDIEGNPEQRTMVVANSTHSNGRNGVFAVIDKSYLANRILDVEDEKIHHIVVRFKDKFYPSSRNFDSDYIHYSLKSDYYGFSLLVEANPTYVRRVALFGLAVSFPLSLLISGVLYLVIRVMDQRKNLSADLKGAIARKELFLVYQPTVNSQSQQLLGLEALIRWKHPSHGMISPDTFIPMAERQLLINALTTYVLEFAYEDFRNIDASSPISLAVNVPPSYLHNKSHIQTLISYSKKFEQIGIEFIVEITERQVLDEVGRSELNSLRDSGVKIAIDDFGTGLTALSVIQNTQFDCLKIDKCFVDTIGVETVNSAVLNTIIELGHRLNVDIVAEGVEHKHQATYLASMGVQKLQGYYFSKPLELDEIKTTWM